MMRPFGDVEGPVAKFLADSGGSAKDEMRGILFFTGAGGRVRRRYSAGRGTVALLQVALLLIAAASPGIAQETPPAQNAPAAPADPGAEVQRKLLGVPAAEQPRQAAPAPAAAIRPMFDFDARIGVEDVDVRYVSCETGLRLEHGYRVDHFRHLFHVSRVFHEPIATRDTQEDVRSREMLYPISEPFDLKGAGVTCSRYLSVDREDDSWLYFPQTRRVRRSSSAQRSDLDSYAGFAAKPVWSEWPLPGVKTILATVRARNMPASDALLPSVRRRRQGRRLLPQLRRGRRHQERRFFSFQLHRRRAVRYRERWEQEG